MSYDRRYIGPDEGCLYWLLYSAFENRLKWADLGEEGAESMLAHSAVLRGRSDVRAIARNAEKSPVVSCPPSPLPSRPALRDSCPD